jgi:hypothetical protein
VFSELQLPPELCYTNHQRIPYYTNGHHAGTRERNVGGQPMDDRDILARVKAELGITEGREKYDEDGRLILLNLSSGSVAKSCPVVTY